MPGFYFERQFWATFEDDQAGILTRELRGVDRLMWGADYPHTEGVWLHSREQIGKDFAGAPEGEVCQRIMLFLYRFPADALGSRGVAR